MYKINELGLIESTIKNFQYMPRSIFNNNNKKLKTQYSIHIK